MRQAHAIYSTSSYGTRPSCAIFPACLDRHPRKNIDPEKFGSKIRAKWRRDRNRQKAKDSKAQSLTGEGTQTAEEADDYDAEENSQVRGCLHVEST